MPGRRAGMPLDAIGPTECCRPGDPGGVRRGALECQRRGARDGLPSGPFDGMPSGRDLWVFCGPHHNTNIFGNVDFRWAK